MSFMYHKGDITTFRDTIVYEIEPMRWGQHIESRI